MADFSKFERLAETQLEKEKAQKIRDKFERFEEEGENEFDAGSSKYFYERVIEVQGKNSFEENLEDEVFLEYLYACLVAWGLERGNQRLISFQEFQEQVSEVKEELIFLNQFEIFDLEDEQDRKQITEKLAEVFNSLDLKEDTNSKVVANSKLLHFLLPELVPPMDRENTGNIYSLGDGSLDDFLKVYFFCWLLGSKNEEYCRSLERNSTKAIDNAIIGYHQQSQ